MNIMELALPLLGKCKIEINDSATIDFAQRQLLNYYVNTETAAGKLPGKKTVLHFYEKKVIDTFSSYEKRNIGLSKEFYWKNSSIKMQNIVYTVSDEEVKVTVLENCSLKETIKKCYRYIKNNNEEKKYAWLSGEFYHNILFPILSVYAGSFGMFCVHGSLIRTKDGRNIILSGLDGVGKSSLADALCNESGNKLLADNIVLFDGVSALNFNIAMRLELDTETSMRILYSNKHIKEVVPEDTAYGLCPVSRIYNLLRDYAGQNIEIFTDSVPGFIWTMFMEKAPEIGQANHIMAQWFFMYGLLNRPKEIEAPIVSLSVPNGKLMLAKEIIVNEFEVFS